MTTISSRAYRDGNLIGEDVDREALEKYLDDDSVLVLIDFVAADRDDLDWITARLNLHPIAVTDALETHTRPKIERYDTHDFLTCYFIDVDRETNQLISHEIALFITPRAIVSVRRHPGAFVDKLEERADKHVGLSGLGVYAVFWAALDVIVDSHFDSVQDMDERLDALEDRVFAESSGADSEAMQRDLFAARKDLVQLRRLTLPMREIVNAVLRDEQQKIPDVLEPYFSDVYDHTLRVNEWVDSMRDLVTSLLDASLTIQGNRMNLIMKKVTSWAAIIAVPTLITGFFGQNVAFFGFGSGWGLVISCALIAVSSLALYAQFKHRDWL